MSQAHAGTPPTNPWQQLEQLSTQARAADTEQALLFVVANETHALLPYRSALVFTMHHGEPMLGCASGLTSVDRGSAFGAWAEQVVKAFLPQLFERQRLSAKHVPEALRTAWQEYWPETVQVHPMAGAGGELLGVVVYITDQAWPEATVPMLNALHQMHGVCIQHLRAQKSPFDFVKQLVDGRNLKSRKVLVRALAGLALALLLPIRQFVIAPAEIISLDAIAVTSPVEGIVAELVAKPNQPVKKGDVLIRLDDTAIRNRLESAKQGLEVSRAEYLAGAHRAFVSSDKTAEAGVLKGRINERLAEVAFLEDQMGMLEIRASRDGIAVYGQENDWIGKPVSAGQRIMELADSKQVGVNAWVPVADAINMQSGEAIHVLLYADPLNPLSATIEQASYQATKSPDGVAAYRVRATLPPQDKVRLGLRGNAKINGDWVVLGYFIFRRPLGSLRQWLGV
ncbi:MAG: HlyD family efflux transporter periplasmic adaptor subunit [Limnohabitans sp.]|uniref:efflux RND transporter periplasmic adaptor subunit n=1 Tax=Limnohabitans sp. TaxID=1907725 RepID=UPI003BAF4401